MIALVAAAALAKPDCQGMVLTDTIPSAGSTNVPVDVRLAAVFVDDDCNLHGDITLALADADGGLIIQERLAAEDLATTGLLEVRPPALLDPDTAYTLTVSVNGFLTHSAPFITGTGTVAGVTGLPALIDVRADFDPSDIRHGRQAGTTLTWSATPADDPDGLSVLQLRDDLFDEDLTTVAATNPSASTFREAHDQEDPPPDEVCVAVRQVDGAGNATAFSEPVCVPVTRPLVSGCSSSGAPVTLGLFFLAPVFRRRPTPGGRAAPA